ASSAIVPAFSDDIAWLAPIRSKPRKTYDEYRLDFSPEGDHTPYIIKKLLDRKADAEKFKEFMSNIGIDSGLFESVKIKKYGSGVTSPFELDIVLNKKQLSISNVGYGVSHALPIIVELFVRNKGSWYAVQQPEGHLHPKAQAALGDAFFQLASIENKKFIIETHSDYTIDRFRSNYKTQQDVRKPKAQILFFERTGSGNKVSSLTIDKNGDLPTDQPSSYRDLFIKEELMNLGI
ncbi:MAG: AAA family ATPase, partial [Thiotrichaceae bacterium]|nr:AAA family ATPase [Thiotrichaceae bacterium]